MSGSSSNPATINGAAGGVIVDAAGYNVVNLGSAPAAVVAGLGADTIQGGSGALAVHAEYDPNSLVVNGGSGTLLVTTLTGLGNTTVTGGAAGETVVGGQGTLRISQAGHLVLYPGNGTITLTADGQPIDIHAADGSGYTTITPANGTTVTVTYDPLTQFTEVDAGLLDILVLHQGYFGPLASAASLIGWATLTVLTPLISAPVVTGLTAATDTGVSHTDGITATTTPVVAGTADPGEAVLVYNGAASIGHTVADASGNWTFQIPTSNPLRVATSAISATGLSVGGVTSLASNTVNVTVEAAAPAIPTIAGLDPASDTGIVGDGVTANTQPTIDGTGDAGSVVTLYEGLAVIGTGTVDATGNWSIASTTTLGDGLHVITAVGADLAGNASAPSGPYDLTINTNRPAAPTLTLDPASDSGTKGDNITNVATPVIGGTAPAGNVVTVSEGSTILGIATANAAGGWSLPIATPFKDGVHVLTATDTDGSGGAASNAATLSLTIGTTPPATPTLTLDPASDSGTKGDGITNVVHPTIDGHADAGTTVTISQAKGAGGPAVLGTVVADASGVWSYADQATSGDATYTLSATATDAVGNTGAAGTLSFTLDTATPAAPSVTGLDPASDSGTKGDGTTNVVRPLIDGTAPAGNTIGLYDGGTLVATGTADTTGNWSIAPTGTFAAGPHVLTATDTSAAGNVSAFSRGTTVTVDTTKPAAPTLSLDTDSDSGTKGDNLTNAASPLIDGTAPAGAVVTLAEGTTILGTATANASGLWSIAATGTLADGPHTLTATDTTAAGNISSAGTLALTIATAPPVAPTLALDPASDSGTKGDNITNVVGPNIDFHSASGDSVVISQTLGAGGPVNLGTVVITGSGDWTFSDVSASGDGTYTLSATQTDVAGNTSAAGTLTFTLDTATPAAPSVTGLDPASDSGTKGDGITNVTRPLIDGTAPAGNTIGLYDGGTLVATGTADATGNWSIAPTGTFAAGPHVLTATDTSAAGNVSAFSRGTTVTIDTTKPAAPTLSLDLASDSGTKGDNLTNVAAPVIDGTAPVGAVVTLADGTTILGTATADAAGHWSITATGTLADGPHTLTATDTNAAGNVSSAGTLALTIETAPPAAPTLSLDPGSDSGTKGDAITNVVHPTIDGHATPGAQIAETITGGSLIGAIPLGATTADASGNWSVTVNPLLPMTDGAYTVSATQTDPAGNTSAAGTFTYTLDTTTPLPPALLGLDPASDSGTKGDGITNVTRPFFDGKANVGDTISLYDGRTLVATGTADSLGHWTLAPTLSLGDGPHVLTATDTSAAGNVSSTSNGVSIVIDTTPPATPTLTLDPASDSGTKGDNLTNVAVPTIDGTAQAGDLVTLAEGSTILATGTADARGNWALTPTTPLTGGVHTLTATDTDSVGNTSAAATLGLTIKTVPPKPPIIAGLTPATDTGSSHTDGITTDTTPVVTGTAARGSIVTLYDGTTMLGTATADANGAWSVQVPTALTIGSHALTATATDAAANTSALSMPAAIVITLQGGDVTVAPIVVDGPDPFQAAALAGLQRILGANWTSGGADNVVYYTPGTLGGAMPGGQTSGLLLDDTSDGTTVLAPPSLQVIRYTGSGAVTIAGGTGDGGGTPQAFLATGGDVTFFTGGASGTFIADEALGGGGTGNNLVATPETGGGSFVIATGGGNDTIVAASGDNSISAGTGQNWVWLGSGDNVVDSTGADTVIGGAGNATVDASAANPSGGSPLVFQNGTALQFINGAGAATVIGGSANATLFGGSGRMEAWGGSGSNVAFGGTGGGNVLVGGAGANTLAGGGDGDLLLATSGGTNLLAASAGNTTLFGGGTTGSNLYFTGTGNDVVVTGDGADTVVTPGGTPSGHATIFEGAGSSVVFAYDQGDTIVAGTGNATIVTGGHPDLFAFANGSGGGSTTLWGFDPTQDQLALWNFGADEAAQAVANQVAVGGSTQLTLSDGTQIMLANVQGVTAQNFV